MVVVHAGSSVASSLSLLWCSPAGAVQGPDQILVRGMFCSEIELELELIQPQMAQKPMLRGEVGARGTTWGHPPQARYKPYEIDSV